MLDEVKNVKQHDGESFRRWFADSYFDLIVWEDTSSKIQSFHLCYEKNINEKAVIWSAKSGFNHLGIDDGESVQGHYKMSPILVADGTANINALKERFMNASELIEEQIAKFVIQKLSEYEDTVARIRPS